MKDKRRKLICEECNIYKETCNGISKFKPNESDFNCKNRIQSQINNTNPLQVAAFNSLYNIKVLNGESQVQAFSDAIVQTSDDVFEAIKRDKVHLIASYYAMKGTR